MAGDRPEGMTSNSSKEKSFEATDVLFRGAMISALAENIVDSYMHLFTAQEMWDTLETKFRVSNAGSELYIIEKFHQCKMIENHSMI